MTTNPKPRKATAKPKKAPSKPKREASKIQELTARWKWLEADQDYQTAIAPRERDADRRHDAEQERIVAKLRTLVPQDYYELTALFRFVIDEIKIVESLRCDGADLDMLSNTYDALFDVHCAERETAIQMGMKNMREFLKKRTDVAFDAASDPETIKRISWGNAWRLHRIGSCPHRARGRPQHVKPQGDPGLQLPGRYCQPLLPHGL